MQRARLALSRRSLVSAASVSLAVGLPAARAAAATRANTRVKLTFRAWTSNASYTTEGELMQRAIQPWLAQNPGVDLTVIPQDNGIGDVVSEILAGIGPDIYHSWHPQTVFSNPAFAMDLTGYVRKYNADLSVFNQAQLAVFQQPRGLLALPYYLGTYAALVNLALFDDAGLKYPTADWSYLDYTDLARGLTKRSPDPSKQVWGGSIGIGWMGSPPDDSASDPFVPPFIAWGFGGGGYTSPTNPARCIADSPGTVKAMDWAYGLQREGVLGTASAFFSFNSGQYAIVPGPSFFLPTAATDFRGMKWDFFPMPAFPAGTATGATEDMTVLNPNTKYPDIAWDFMHWLAWEPAWQRSMMQIYLLSPALTALWDEWVQVVGQFAPPLQGKNLSVFADMAQSNRAFPKQVFSYEATEADAILGEWGDKIAARQVSVQEGLTQATNEVNALEAQGPQTEAAAVARMGQMRTYLAKAAASHGAITFPAPARNDGGVAATPAPQLVQADARTATYTVRGAGTGLTNYPNDNDTFACAAYRSSRGVFSCRITAVAPVAGTSIAGGAKVGLMARSSLGNSAALVALVLGAGHGAHFDLRPVSVANGSDEESGGSLPNTAGLLNTSASGKNYLSRPFWVRLALDGDTWTGFTSLDGKAWMPAGGPVTMEAIGCWIGLVVTSRQSGHYISATFDHLAGFKPDTFVQIGSP